MIGTRVGTGGRSGEQYLKGAEQKIHLKEVAGILTSDRSRSIPNCRRKLRKALRSVYEVERVYDKLMRAKSRLVVR